MKIFKKIEADMLVVQSYEDGQLGIGRLPAGECIKKPLNDMLNFVNSYQFVIEFGKNKRTLKFHQALEEIVKHLPAVEIEELSEPEEEKAPPQTEISVDDIPF